MYIGNMFLLSPVLWMLGAALLVLFLGIAAAPKRDGWIEHFLPAHYLAPSLTAVGLVAAGGLVYWSLLVKDSLQSITVAGEELLVPANALFVTSGGHAQFTVDPFAAIFTFVAVLGTLMVMLLSIDYFGEFQRHKAEYYCLLMLAAAAASLVAGASDLIAIYLSIEFLSLTSYVLAAFDKENRRSAEAGMKYFIYGAACSAVMLQGMSILFGVSGGATSLSGIAQKFSGMGMGSAVTAAGWVGVTFTLVGLGFKLSLAGFHFWAPDTYEGAPTPVTAFLSVVSKAAGIAVLARFVLVAALPGQAGSLSWYWILVILTTASMFYGNLAAIAQTNIKRMLAYSSIAQIGYIMVGVLAAMHVFTREGSALSVPNASIRTQISAAGGHTGPPLPWDLRGVIMYVLAYLFMNIGAFAVVTAVGKRLRSDAIKDYADLARRSPLMAGALAVFLVSLAGVPPTAGFLGKLFVFGSAVNVGMAGHVELIVLAAFGVINSVISAYYYFNVVRLMYFAPASQSETLSISFAARATVVSALLVTLGLIVFTKPVSDLAAQAVYRPLDGLSSLSGGEVDL